MIKVLIADDHPIVREGLKRILSECNDMSLVGEAATGQEALDGCANGGIDVLLLDISMPGPGFLDVLSRIRAKHPETKILVLSIHPEDHYAVRAIKAGAAGYLTKNHSTEELATAVRQVHEGHRYVTSDLAEKLVAIIEAGEQVSAHEKLSNREYQILCGIGSGKNTSELASELSLSPKTISTYRYRILAKMKLKSASELIRYTVEKGLV